MTEMSEDELKTFQIEALVRRARSVAAEMKSLGEISSTLKAKLEELVPVGWKQEIDGIPASRKLGNRSFDPKLALDRMTPDQKMSCVSTGINNKVVREIADAMGITEDCMAEPDASKTSVRLS